MKLLYLLTAIVLFTQLRGGVLLVMPLILLYFNKIQPYHTAEKKVVILFCLFFISAFVGIMMGWTTFSGVFLSIWLFLPILRCFYARPRFNPQKKITIQSFIKTTQPILFIVNFIGLIIWLKQHGDEFGIAYGRHFEYVHGLALVNLMYFFYYIVQIFYNKKSRKNIILAILFFISFALCDFGLGWVTLFLTILTYMLLNINFKYALLFICTISLAYIALQTDKFSYEKQNIDNVILNPDDARKAIMFYETKDLFNENPLITLLGTGAGGYNSRASILLTNDSDNIFNKILGSQSPQFYQKYIYPLWNKSFVSQSDFTDGTRNKPFSSFVAIFCEQGIIFGFILFFSFIQRIYTYHRQEKKNSILTYLVLINLFMFISCIIHEWMISTEFILFLIINYISLCELRQKQINS